MSSSANTYKHLSGAAKRKRKLEIEQRKEKLPKLDGFLITSKDETQQQVQKDNLTIANNKKTAGAGGKCKHIVACLLFINRNELEQLSTTDVEQALGQRKSVTYTDYVQPLTDFCHVKKNRIVCKATPELLSNVFQELMSEVDRWIPKYPPW
ncbi:hypothetical protein RN001_001828 [Aquatica leii]|uniref:Uncharacterized protein n=1 Tax=Aquatica leii TaxID=1421715 RepID=A0AAN7SJT1_9COLE|nr:hypothetical protein RN001_001828 [Aquatica leii]